MAFWKRAPDPRLSEHVEGIAFSIDPPDRPSPPIRVVPDGRVDLLVSVSADGRGRADVFGTKTAPLWARSECAVANVAVSFRPGGAAALLGVSADSLTDRVVAAADLLGAELASRLIDAQDLHTRGVLLEAALLARVPSAVTDAARLARAAVARIERSSGRAPIARLALELGVGERRLERAFRTHVGIAPKTFARIARFRAGWRALESGGAAVEVALARGYFDQAHLLRDFRAFAGEAPRRIFPSRAVSLAVSVEA
ncbi:MAG: helix-turn-helix domain-containing protein [Solirubrobacteraceae bacterium]